MTKLIYSQGSHKKKPEKGKKDGSASSDEGYNRCMDNVGCNGYNNNDDENNENIRNDDEDAAIAEVITTKGDDNDDSISK